MVEAPPDMKTAQFLEDLITGGVIQGSGWILHDKDLLRDLDPGVTLEENGVQDGHHIYLRTLEPKPLPPPPDRWRNWLTFLAVLVPLLTGVVGFQLGNRSARGASDAAQRQLQTELDHSRSRELELRAQLANLREDMRRGARDAEANLRVRLAAMEEQLQQARTDVDRSNGSLRAAEMQVQRLQAAVSQLRNPKAVGFVAWGGDPVLNRPVTIRGQSISSGRIRGRLPDRDFRAYLAESTQPIEVIESPSPANGWQLAFTRREGRGSLTAWFVWLVP